ncbi:MAG: Smr/MutS family protein [Flavobacteriales bacterium]|nr:Smr/MutS family protein [Flavobacteriales bacterium]
MALTWNTGDRVSFLNEVGGGVVVRAKDGGVLVLTDDGFELEYSAADLVRAEADKERSLGQISDHQARLVASNDRLQERIAKDLKRQVPLRKATRNKERPDGSVMEVDLHLDALLDDERGMSDGEKLQYQLDYFERMLNTAIRERKRRLIAIHGVGEGKLREEIRRLLQHFPHLEFDDADPRRYGYGATEVHLHPH